MRDRDVEVVELHNVLTETTNNPEAKAWLPDRKIVANEVGLAHLAAGQHTGGRRTVQKRGRRQGDRRRHAQAACAAMHLDRLFTSADRDVVTIYPEIVNASCTRVGEGGSRHRHRQRHVGVTDGRKPRGGNGDDERDDHRRACFGHGRRQHEEYAVPNAAPTPNIVSWKVPMVRMG